MGTIGWTVSRETYRCAVLVLAAAAVLAGCGGSGKKESVLAAPFAYDASKPLNLKSRDTSLGSNGTEVRDVSYDGPAERRLKAYLLSPPGEGRHPAVIFVHGAVGTRSELLSEAADMTRQGAVALTLEMSYSPSRATPLPPGMAGLRARIGTEVDSVREVRRAVDLLRSLPSVDGDQIGYVGWSAGARIGAIAAGVDHRIRAFDLIAGGAIPVKEYVRLAPPNMRVSIGSLLGRTDPLRYVGHAAPSALLFQDGRRDEIVPQAALKALASVGSDPKELRWYDTGHAPGPKAWTDSRRWLADRLGLTGS
jgi:dienelactone hydrolase